MQVFKQNTEYPPGQALIQVGGSTYTQLGSTRAPRHPSRERIKVHPDVVTFTTRPILVVRDYPTT